MVLNDVKDQFRVRDLTPLQKVQEVNEFFPLIFPLH